MTERWRYRSWTIGAKTLISHAALALFAIVFACVLAYALSFRFVQDKAIEGLVKQAEYIASYEVQKGPELLLPDRRTIDQFQNLTSSMVLYVNRSFVLTHIGTQADAPPGGGEFTRTEIISAIDQQFVSRMFSGETVADIRQFEFASGVILFAGTPVRNVEGKVIGGVILAQPVAQIRSLTKFLQMLLIMTALVTVMFAVAVALKLTQVLTNPIRRLTQVARRIAEGELGAHISIPNHDELGELGNTLNTLSARLSDVIRRLREERDKLELIIGSIGEGIIAVNARLEGVHRNQAFWELMEAGNPDHPGVEDTDGFRALQKLLEECVRCGERLRAGWQSPSGRKVAATASPLFDERGETIGAVCLIQDVSESERLEQLRRDYVANISHELRTPLTGIRGMVEPLMDGYIDTDEERSECYRVIYQETLRLEKLVREMLDMSRLQDGRVALEMEELELRGIVDAAVRRMKNMADDAGISLTADTGSSALTCIGNEDRILQVLIIFIDNALGFTPAGGSVTVYARDERDIVRVGVVDTGVGIEPKDLPFIWERFYKADKSRMRTSGTGLGLAVAKLVVELMGGEIGVNARTGGGSEFFFTLKKSA
ncbi:MAG: cell wall metabolism sensor histidine kinase WalK [Clostridiales bacterium]|jgi:signal transduction histidine kinase|nr:cell wall metabolism sensor histidine kinase WalK [Clostridiales bacterium]